jgi:hypothetical protein
MIDAEQMAEARNKVNDKAAVGAASALTYFKPQPETTVRATDRNRPRPEVRLS